MSRFVTVIDADGATDLAGATIEPRDSSSALVVREAVCSASACAVQLEILDLTASRAVPIPRPIDAINDFLRVRLADGGERHVLITVWPLDTISNSGSPSPIRGAIFASTASSETGGTFEGSPRDPEPIRWLVMGDVALDGDLDVAGTPAGGIGGGGAGGAVGAAAPSGGGAGGAASGGGGGGAVGSAGEPGSGAAAGTGGEPTSADCIADFTAVACGGGGGGGGAEGAGGAGGGTILIASLGAVSISGAIRAGGAEGEPGGGGGGGGGDVLIVGASVDVTGSTDVQGGQGGAPADGTGEGAGGTGGAGRARIVDPASEPAADASGVVAFDVLGADLIVTAADYVVRGVATPGSTVQVTAIDRPGITADTVAGSDGSFSVPITLEPGVNRIRLTTESVRAWNGTSFELVRVDGAAMPQPVGGVLDVAYVPGA